MPWDIEQWDAIEFAEALIMLGDVWKEEDAIRRQFGDKADAVLARFREMTAEDEATEDG